MNSISPARLAEGIHAGVPEATYHADPAPEPSASASVLKALFRKSPEHAYNEHPRLNPDWSPSGSSDAKDYGTILHAMILGTPAPWRVFTHDSWRGKAADDRDRTRDAGMIPILSHKLEGIEATAVALRRRIERDFPDLHAALRDPDTLKEATIICRVNGVMCRTRVDVLPPARYGFIADFKFTGMEVFPSKYERTLKEEYRIQSDLYPRAVLATRGDEPEFRFYAAEESAPYGMAAYSFTGSAQERNRNRTNVALDIWSACLKAREWPGYPTMLHLVDDEPYEDQRDTNAVMRHSAAAQVSAGTIAKIHRIAARLGGPVS